MYRLHCQYVLVFVDEVVVEVTNVGLLCTCFCSDEYFVCFSISEVLLEFLFDKFFTVENTDSHIFVGLKYNLIWVVDEFTEGLLLQLTDAGGGEVH